MSGQQRTSRSRSSAAASACAPRGRARRAARSRRPASRRPCRPRRARAAPGARAPRAGAARRARGQAGATSASKSACASLISAPSARRVAGLERRACLPEQARVARAERLAHARRERARRVGKAGVQVGEDAPRVLAAAQVDDQQVQRGARARAARPRTRRRRSEEGHAPPEGADLVHAPALGAGAPLARVGQLHLVARRERRARSTDAKRARDQHADRGRRRQALAHRQVAGHAQAQTADAVALHHLRRDAGRVAEEAAPRAAAASASGRAAMRAGPIASPEASTLVISNASAGAASPRRPWSVPATRQRPGARAGRDARQPAAQSECSPNRQSRPGTKSSDMPLTWRWLMLVGEGNHRGSPGGHRRGDRLPVSPAHRGRARESPRGSRQRGAGRAEAGCGNRARRGPSLRQRFDVLTNVPATSGSAPPGARP